MKTKRHIKLSANGKFGGALLSKMRETAFGNRAVLEVSRTLRRAEDMRDDDALLAQAEAKRARKAARNRGQNGS